MLQFLRKLLGQQKQTFPLGLADPSHPAKKWIDTATVIADRRMDLNIAGEDLVIKTDSNAMSDLAATLDLALGEAPNCPDLLTTRAAAYYALKEIPKANDDLDHALSIDSTHPEASVLRKYGQKWDNILSLPAWSSDSQYVHPVLADKANQGDIMHCVRHCLQPAIVVLLITSKEDYPNAPARYQWEVVCSKTPFGPIGAHYILLDVNGRVCRQECFISPSIEVAKPDSPPSSLLGRFPSVKTCFIVLATSEGEVLYNLRYDLPPGTRSVLKKMTRQLSNASGINSSNIRKASEWHMQNFDMDALTIR